MHLDTGKGESHGGAVAQTPKGLEVGVTVPGVIATVPGLFVDIPVLHSF